jgi:hypothetical protein
MQPIRIKFSRHAKRRMAMYDLSEPTVEAIIGGQKRLGGVSEGKNEVIDHETLSKYGYPIKVVFSCEENHITVITAYPLKRGRK